MKRLGRHAVALFIVLALGGMPVSAVPRTGTAPRPVGPIARILKALQHFFNPSVLDDSNDLIPPKP